MRTNHFAYLAAILAGLSAPFPCRAEADLNFPARVSPLSRRLSCTPMNR
jgi:hypothetical protein